MKKCVCLSLLLVFISLGFAQQVEQKSDLQAMVETERAFAKMSVDQGTRAAFVAFIADDGILFRPRAVKGKQWFLDHPAPASAPSDKRPSLNWYPAIAEISRAGDMGFTTGPWELKRVISDAQPSAWGNFLTIWKKQADGTFKYAIDLGISNPQPSETIAPWQPPASNKKAERRAEPKTATEQSALLARDREFASATSLSGAKATFDAFAADNVRVLRNGKQPFVGKAVAAPALPDNDNVWNWEPAFADTSRSGDLGYTYGTYRILKKDATPTVLESGNYFRIWKKQGNKWLVVADVMDPVREEKKS
jgi:ketosteroid isomerase-like protein